MDRALRHFGGAVVFFLFAPALLVVGADDLARGGVHSNNAALFSAEEYLSHIRYLASDELEGRGTGQVGIDKAADYIASAFEALGVEPAGDDGSFFQTFSLKLKSRVGEDTRLSIGTKGRHNRRRVPLGQGFTPFPFSSEGEFSGEVVFAGYGIVNDELDYDDYKGVDVEGKVVLMLRRAPAFGDFSTRDASLVMKAAHGVEEQAAGIIVVNPVGDEAGDALFDFDSGGAGGFRRADYGIPMMHVTRRCANRMLKAAGLSGVAAVQERIENSRGPISRPLDGVSVRGNVSIEPVETPARNVVGLIPGRGEDAEEIIVLGAHYDHLGVCHKGLPEFDASRHISNGADDNASGTAMVLAMAKAYTQGAGPNRSILLIAFSAEELGLFGSRHFVQHPTVDLGQCVAMLNFDMVGRLRDDRLDVYGLGSSPGFSEMVDRLAEPYGLNIRSGTTFFGGSDHAPFYRAGLPVMFFFTGIHKQYHQAEDDTELINADGAMRIAKLAADCIDEIDADPERPAFKEGKSNRRGERRRGRQPVVAGSKRESKSESKPELASQSEFATERQSGPPAEVEPTFGGRSDRVVLGVMLGPEKGMGVVVARVSKDSPASRAGVRRGDWIVGLGDKTIASRRDLVAALGGFERGVSTIVTVRRGEDVLKLGVVFGRPGEEVVRQAVKLEAESRNGVDRLIEDGLVAGEGGLDRQTEVTETVARQLVHALDMFLPHLDDEAEVSVEIKGGRFTSAKLAMSARLWRDSMDDIRVGELPLALRYALKVSRDDDRRPEEIVVGVDSQVQEGIVKYGFKFNLTLPLKYRVIGNQGDGKGREAGLRPGRGASGGEKGVKGQAEVLPALKSPQKTAA